MLSYDEHKHIAQRLETLEAQRKHIEDGYGQGHLSEQDYKKELAKNDYLVAEIKERNAQDQEKTLKQEKGRGLDLFGD